jgi:hypothetical protein
MRRLQVDHARMLARRWRGDANIVAWDLTDEPPFWIVPDTTDDDARAWTDALAAGLREADPDRLITIGTSGQEVGWGAFRADVIGESLDFLCVHPYPIYQPELYPDGLLAPRMTHAAAFETALAGGTGRSVMVHEFGASSANFDPEAIAAYDRLLEWSSLGRGATGYFAWCWTDAEPAAFRRAPYVRQPHETQFGVTDHRGNLRPRGRVLAELAATARTLDLDGLASGGPVPATTAIVVPHEYVRPDDAAAYGLDGTPSGVYRSSTPAVARDGRADPAPLVRAWLNAFVLAARADIPVRFVRERVDAVWPQVRLVLLPAPLPSTTVSLWHVRTSYWSGAPDFYSRGGVLYLSCSADVAIPEMDALAGCRLADRAPADRPAMLRFVRPWGPLRTGDELALPNGDGGLTTRGVRLALGDAEPVALDADGAPALVVAARGQGHAVTCAYPIELLLAAVPDAHGREDRSWALYAGLADLAAARGVASCDDPQVTLGSLHGSLGGLTAVTNHGPDALDVEIRLADHVRSASVTAGGETSPSRVDGGGIALALDAFGAAIVSWRAD